MRGLLELSLPWWEVAYLSPRDRLLRTMQLKSSLFQVHLANGRDEQGIDRQEKNEVAGALVLSCQRILVPGSKWEEEKEKKAYWKFPNTLLLHFLWSEPSCVKSLYSWG